MNKILKTLNKLTLFKDNKITKIQLLKHQGYCNINYKIITVKKEYLLRVFKDDTTVNISRDFEFCIQKKVAKKGIAPKPFVLNLKRSFMITEFINGTHKYQLNNQELIKLIKTIKKIHTFKIAKKEYDFKKDFKTYSEGLKDRSSQKLIKESLSELKKIKKYPKKLVLTHHDLNAKNIIFTKNKLKIIDWEYAGANDLFFDLASVCCEFALSKKQHHLLLNTYFKKIRKKDIQRLKSYNIIYKNLSLLWFRDLEKKETRRKTV